ncbi:hypothetical protein [Phormidium sp. CCY1219]|nr:hypothetical protein [Phormidium sp. CCY1219]MEB3830944.1 hypothetical protein [Phormidium sp. CCY1219]
MDYTTIRTIPANRITLRMLKERLGLQFAPDAQFFPEWRETHPTLSDTEE